MAYRQLQRQLLMLSDILPTGFEIGVVNGRVKPGGTVGIVGCGPIGMAAMLTARFFSPSELIMIDVDDNRLEVARSLGATRTINNRDGKAMEAVMALTQNLGVDVAIEAIGIPAGFDLCQNIVAAGGHLANIGVHGKPEQLIMHTFALKDGARAHETFGNAMKERAMKVIITAS